MTKHSEDRFKGIAYKGRVGSGQGETEETTRPATLLRETTG